MYFDVTAIRLIKALTNREPLRVQIANSHKFANSQMRPVGDDDAADLHGNHDVHDVDGHELKSHDEEQQREIQRDSKWNGILEIDGTKQSKRDWTGN